MPEIAKLSLSWIKLNLCISGGPTWAMPVTEMATPCPVLTFTVGTLMVIVFRLSLESRQVNITECHCVVMTRTLYIGLLCHCMAAAASICQAEHLSHREKGEYSLDVGNQRYSFPSWTNLTIFTFGCTVFLARRRFCRPALAEACGDSILQYRQSVSGVSDALQQPVFPHLTPPWPHWGHKSGSPRSSCSSSCCSWCWPAAGCGRAWLQTSSGGGGSP